MARFEDIDVMRRIPHDPRFRLYRFDLNGLDLSGADLRGIDLRAVQISNGDFSGANLDGVVLAHSRFNHCNFTGASMRETHPGESQFIGCSFERACLERSYMVMGLFHSAFFRADLTHAVASWADFRGANLDEATLRGTVLQNADMSFASLRNAALAHAEILNTTLASTNLGGATGLELVRFSGPALIDPHTVRLSGGLPVEFLKSAGLPDEVIDFYRSIPGAIHFHSCFISHSDQDRDFAAQLTLDLRNAGIRCWNFRDSLKIGEPMRTTFQQAIHVHDKLLVILSENALASQAVESEVEIAFEDEQKENRRVVFPIRLDAEALHTTVAWASEIRRRYWIGDFSQWGNPEQYATALARLLADLKRR